MMRWDVRAAAAALVLLGAPVVAGEAQEQIFRVNLLEEVKTGDSVTFSRTRVGSVTSDALPAIDSGAIEVAVVEGADGREALVELRSGDQPTSRSVLPADGGHPVLLIFLESSARSVAELTGGSPFYIRNRMREALGENVPFEPVELTIGDEVVPAQAVTFRPFVDDPNRAKMGPLADFAITMVLSDMVPGGFARFEAIAGGDAAGDPAYRDTIVFAGLKGG